MKKKTRTSRKRLSAAEIDLMQHLWSAGECTVTELQKLVNDERQDPVSRNTVQVQLQRIEDKGWVLRVPKGRLYLYRPTVSEEEGMAELTSDFRNKVFGGSALAMVRCLVDAGEISGEEISELKKLINKTAREGKK